VGQRRRRQEALSTVIEAISFELRDNPSFVSELFIEKHDGGGVTATRSLSPAFSRAISQHYDGRGLYRRFVSV